MAATRIISVDPSRKSLGELHPEVTADILRASMRALYGRRVINDPDCFVLTRRALIIGRMIIKLGKYFPSVLPSVRRQRRAAERLSYRAFAKNM